MIAFSWTFGGFAYKCDTFSGFLWFFSSGLRLRKLELLQDFRDTVEGQLGVADLFPACDKRCSIFNGAETVISSLRQRR